MVRVNPFIVVLTAAAVKQGNPTADTYLHSLPLMERSDGMQCGQHIALSAWI